MHILFATSEIAPYSKTSGLADVSRSLPAELRMRGAEVSIVTPLYADIDPQAHRFAERLTVLDVPYGADTTRVSVFEGRTEENVRIFLLRHDELFARAPIYRDEAGVDYPDNGLRFGLFSKAVCELMRTFAVPVDVVHCNDWQTALVPVFLEECYADSDKLANVMVVMTIHNLANQGRFSPAVLEPLGLPDYLNHPDHLEFHGDISFLKGGLLYTDLITTVSPRYAEEIRTAEYGCGLEGVLQRRAEDLVGVVSGVDYTTWDTQRDEHLPVHFDEAHLNGKRRCKVALQHECGLEVNPTRPLLAFIGRLTELKGVDLISDILDDLIEREAQLVLLGDGEPPYQTALRAWATEFPGRVTACIGFDEPLAHRILAGADMLLIPSRYEPFSLVQLYALRYGTVPVARATGGLADTIVPVTANHPDGTGFLFDEFHSDAFLGAATRALDAFGNQRQWRAIQNRGMRADFSWRASANEYLRRYQELISQ